MSLRADELGADILVLGGGMAGATIAAHLAEAGREVVLLEREAVCGHHTTGRSAAMFIPSYGPAAVRPLTLASRAFLERPPLGFGGVLLTPRNVLHVARRDQLERLERLACAIASPARLSSGEAREMAPILRAEEVAAAVLETDAADIDVARLHVGYLRLAQEAGAEIVKAVGVPEIFRSLDAWRVKAAGRSFAAPVLVNATGAWADETAIAAGVEPKGLQPLQRTVVLVDAPAVPGFAEWPIVKDVDERFYFRPFASKLLVTPADEAPSPPCDAQPDVLDVACAMSRFHDVADHPIRTIRRQWAGLRTFAADRAPVIGWSEQAAGFFWFAGFGGFGIQTAEAAGRLGAGLIQEGVAPPELTDAGVAPAAFAPDRPALQPAPSGERRRRWT